MMSEENLNLERSGSSNVSSSFDYSIRGDERLFAVLYKKVDDLTTKIHELETQKILDETKIPKEILENSGLLPDKPRKWKRGRGYRQILQSEIEEVKKKTPFGAQQAKLLGCHVETYKRYAKMYGLWEPSPNVKGKRNIFDPNKGKYPLTEVLEGKHPNVSDFMVKDKLIRSKILPPKCNICGYDKRRIVDGKIALLLDHKDGNDKNFTLDNLQLLCFNCTFECGRGYIRRGKHMFDPDWIQNARIDEINEKTRW
jgi:hypothetical protein